MEGLTMKYFTLKPQGKSKDDLYAAASRKAMRAYANHIQVLDPSLAEDLRSWANKSIPNKLKTIKKTIVVKWVPEETFDYGIAMRVIESNHKRFSVGTRFDFGFFNIATKEGYTIISLPMQEKEVNNK